MPPTAPSSTGTSAVPKVPYATGGNPSSGPRTLSAVLRILRWTVYACALLVLVLLLHKSAPPPVVTTPEAASRAERKFADVQQAVAQGQPATLRMDETELNSYLASHLELSGNGAAGTTSVPGRDQATTETVEQMRSNVRDVKVQLLDDRVRAYVVFVVHGKEMTLQLEGRLGADNGFLKFEPVSGQIGALPIPQSTLEAAVRRLMDSPENREKLKLPDDISGLKIENGEVVAQYQ